MRSVLLCATVVLALTSAMAHSDTAMLQDLIDVGCNQSDAVLLPNGTFVVDMPSPAIEATLAIVLRHSNCHIRGATTNSTVLKFSQEVNVNNWWRMIGAAPGTENLTLSDFTIDGSTNWTAYDQCKGDAGFCEHNAGLFFYVGGFDHPVIRNVTVQRVHVHSIGGDAMDFADGVQDVAIRDVKIADFLRQGIDFGGDNRSVNFAVSGASELTWKTVERPGGSTLHVEEARGLTNVAIVSNVVHHGIAASSATNMIIRDNLLLSGSNLVANGDVNVTIRNNTLSCTDKDRHFGTSISLLSPQTALIEDNTVDLRLCSTNGSSFAGLYLWGDDRHWPFAKNVTVRGNRFLGLFEPIFRGRSLKNGGIILDGVDGVRIEGSNEFVDERSFGNLTEHVCVCCRYGQPDRCRNVRL